MKKFKVIALTLSCIFGLNCAAQATNEKNINETPNFSSEMQPDITTENDFKKIESDKYSETSDENDEDAIDTTNLPKELRKYQGKIDKYCNKITFIEKQIYNNKINTYIKKLNKVSELMRPKLTDFSDSSDEGVEPNLADKKKKYYNKIKYYGDKIKEINEDDFKDDLELVIAKRPYVNKIIKYSKKSRDMLAEQRAKLTKKSHVMIFEKTETPHPMPDDDFWKFSNIH